MKFATIFYERISYFIWIAQRLDQDCCRRLLAHIESPEQLPIIHILLTANDYKQSDQQLATLPEYLSVFVSNTISDLTAQTQA